MQLYQTTQTWGYKIRSDHHISFYHVLLSSIPPQLLADAVSEISSVQKEADGSVTIYFDAHEHIEEVLRKILSFFNQKSIEFFDTPKMYYKIPPMLRQSLLSWGLAFEGCLALLLLANEHTSLYFNGKWNYLNAKTGGLYLSPYTLLLYKDHPKIVHPVSVTNYIARKTIEQKTAHAIRNISRRMGEAQKGLEGLALLSLVEEKTTLSPKKICSIIHEKSFQITAPVYSPFFAEHSR